MQTWIYKGAHKANTYLYVDREDDFSQVPDALLNLLGELALVVHVDLHPERKLAQTDTAQVMEMLEQKGFFLQLPPGDAESETLC